MRTPITRLSIVLSAAVVAATLGVPSAVAGTEAARPACTPSEAMDLSQWKVQLPTGEDEKPDEVEQPELDEFSVDPWFTGNEACDGVQFRAAVNGVTTSGSDYPRSELREMDGEDKAEWSTSEGTHTMVINEAITHLPADKPHVVAGQIHGGDDDLTVFRLEGSKLYVTDGDEAHHKLVIDDYELGTPFEAKFVAGDGKIKAYFNGELQTTIEVDSSTAYFKAGAYTQANCERSDPCEDGNYGEVQISSVSVTHE
ncbi:polysaccharide lyase family 7 protein [Amycolatopsis antarctica]|uniref:Polysaccharide lyase family 7 protein n=1 Tax=Amycolatopsis antarctica TaxID=1854586 RepID=A0A263CXW0_9PSEU|nr:polysaccharide lyase family 7 protein [Amycolatopsis antarctica]OZM70982.1 polysaccharide lyase family 7 protein [Amycolatopsis antarctica]